ncbi:MAG: hypothetical protein ACM3UZ_10265 [Acidobacteriota bacterium]
MGRMQCKCGNILSDAEVPNKVRMWVHTNDEWLSVVQKLMDGKWDWKRQWAIWYCPECKRVYAINRLLHLTKVFAVESQSLKECKCVDVDNKLQREQMEKIWAFEDAESDAVYESVREGKADIKPKNKVWYCSECERLLVLCEDKKDERVYYLEQEIDHKY